MEQDDPTLQAINCTCRCQRNENFRNQRDSIQSFTMPIDQFAQFSKDLDKYHYNPLPFTRKEKVTFSIWNSKIAKIIHMIVFGIILPTLCIVIPIYAKFVTYADTRIAFGASDMRVIDSHMSTTWCQSQLVKMNASFEAYLMSKTPTTTPKSQKVSMIRHFELDDDLKEYWGFYLLKGSEVSVSSCARYLGANVMLIKGISSLKFCAYVGQESNEHESNEILGLEPHKLMEQYEMATNNQGDGTFKAPPVPMFGQPNKNDRQRILELLKLRNEKRRIIKLLERQNINSNNNGSQVPAGVVAQVEEALQKILEQEIQSLYLEVKNIIFNNNTKQEPSSTGNGTKIKQTKNRWPLKQLLKNEGAKLSAVIEEDVGSEEDGAYEMDEFANADQLNMTSDGIANDHNIIDHNHPNDTSTSDESSFSSSEEAMLHCRGVLLSQPLVPENQCTNETTPNRNRINYVVEEDGYYYFIFSSANEKVRNKLTVKFDLLKTVFNVSDATDVCHNSTECQFPLHFYSSEKLVVSLPAPENSSSAEWDKTLLAQSICEPRMPIYLGFTLLLPLFIIVCAFR